MFSIYTSFGRNQLRFKFPASGFTGRNDWFNIGNATGLCWTDSGITGCFRGIEFNSSANFILGEGVANEFRPRVNDTPFGSTSFRWKGLFTTVDIGTSLTINAGTPILKVLSATASLDFANQAAIGCNDLTITVTGAAVGDETSIGVPNGSVVNATATFTGWVSATNTVTIRYCQLISGDPAPGTFRATVTLF
jgi:hypothetical protein